MSEKDIMVVVGTRPEAIKMAPLVHALKNRPKGRTVFCVTAQHREMLDQVLEVFDLTPDIDLNLMRPGQDLANLTSRVLLGVTDAIRQANVSAVLVHGDTATCLASGIAAFYEQVPVGHVEAGLRTYNMQSPWPEEMNRRVIDPLCEWCFAPTEGARDNLLSERVSKERIFVTGNTVIDALMMATEKVKQTPPPLEQFDPKRIDGQRLILVTGHRRENIGQGLENMCRALIDIKDAFPDTAVVYPVHLNPKVKGPVEALLGKQDRIHLIPPQSYLPFVWLMQRSTLIITDSGGVQEEAPSLGKPVLVTRETTERPEAIASGAALLVGTDRKKIIAESSRLLSDDNEYKKMANTKNPYGDGQACDKIVTALGRRGG